MPLLHCYLNKLYEIQWYFNENNKSDLESLLFVRFEPNGDHSVIKKVQYTHRYFEITKKMT